MTVNDVILEAAKQFGIDTSSGFVLAVCGFNFTTIIFFIHFNCKIFRIFMQSAFEDSSKVILPAVNNPVCATYLSLSQN